MVIRAKRFNALCQRAADFDWDTIKCEDVNRYANSVRKLTGKGNRLYKRYKRRRTIERYDAFKKVRNDVTALLRKLKKDYFTSHAEKLKTSNLSSSDYWKTLKSFIKPSTTSAVPPILHNGSCVSDNNQKAKLLNDFFFINQTNLDDTSATVPNVIRPGRESLNNITVITTDEDRSVWQTLKLVKSSGPDNINNRILKEIAYPVSKLLSDLFNYSLSRGIFSLYLEAS